MLKIKNAPVYEPCLKIATLDDVNVGEDVGILGFHIVMKIEKY